MKVNGITGSVLRWLAFASCAVALSLSACSSDEQAPEDPMEDSSTEDESGESMDESYEESGYAEEGYDEQNDYSDEVEQTAQEILNGSDDAAADVDDSAAETLEGIMNAGPAEAAPAGSDEEAGTGYEDSYEESDLAAAEEQTIDPEVPQMADSAGEMESLKSSGMDNAPDTSDTALGTVDSGSAIGMGADQDPAAAAPTPAVAPATIPDGTRAVMYVQVSKANVRQGPGTDNAVVGAMVRGERVVATIEGDWARTSKGHYIAASLLTLSPVGRSRPAGLWSSQR